MEANRTINMLKGRTAKQLMNAALQSIELRSHRSVLHSLPVIIEVVPTHQCNLKCIFCKKYETYGDRNVSIDNFKALAKELLPTALMVNFTSGGEPYMHKQLVELLRIARQYNVMINVSSNGMLLEESLIRTIASEELISEHIFSIDGIKASTVERIRVNSDLGIILENIKMFLRIYKELGKSRPSIRIRYALMRSNIEELPEAVQYWGNMGIEALSCNYVSVCRDVDPNESLYYHQELMEEVFDKAVKVSKHYPKLHLELPLTIRQAKVQRKSPRTCKYPWIFAYICGDGRVFPCYQSWGANTMGNIYSQDIDFKKDIWNSSTYQTLRRTANNDTLTKQFPYCAVCEDRFGYGDLAAHLGDKTWFEYLDVDPVEKARIIAHRGS